MVYQSLLQNNATIAAGSLLGATQRPMTLGFVYQVYFLLATSYIVRAEVYIELYSNKITLKAITN